MNNNLVALFIVIFYLAMRFFGMEWVDSFGTYASYFFEGLFCILVLIYYRKHLNFKGRLPRSFLLSLIVSIPLGWLTYKGAGWQGIQIPFDLSARETLLLLGLVGPILEEMIFRQALWYPLETLLRKTGLVVAVTAALFSFAHFSAYFYVPAAFKPFVVYQTAYTFLLGIWWGQMNKSTPLIWATAVLHILYNWGFYFGYLY